MKTNPAMSETPTEKPNISDPAPVSEDALLRAEKAGLSLVMTESGLALTDGALYLCADLSQNLRRLQTNNLRQELLVKAARIKNPDHPLHAIDATAGFGEDALLLAASGFSVDLYEYDPVIAALLRDALRRAAAIPELAETAGRMHLHAENSIAAMHTQAKMQTLSEDTASFIAGTEDKDKSAADPGQGIALPSAARALRPDVILLDPMFPARDKSALIKKKFQLLQRLEQPCGDEQELLAAAFAAHPHKIVIKRPLKGPFLAERKPDYSLKGKAIRYDCFVIA